LWRHFKYAILVSFIVAAVLTTSPDPWNQTAFALPMIALYLISIVIAWIVGPKSGADTASDERKKLGLVIAAAAFEQARRRRQTTLAR
jgi:sec-independent protein translocase protein TatC